MPLSPEDRIAIGEVLARYCHATDQADGQGVADLFIESGILEITGAWQARGRAEIARIGDVPNKGRHWLNSIVIDGSGSTATAKSYYASIWFGGPLLSTGYYESELTKELSGQWKLVLHRYTGDPLTQRGAVRARQADPMALTALDRIEIMDLLSRAHHAFEAHDVAAFGALLSDDVVFQIDDRPALHGKDAVRVMLEDTKPEPLRYWATNLIVLGTRERATLKAYVAHVRERRVIATGIYTHGMAYEDGRWLCVHWCYASDKRP